MKKYICLILALCSFHSVSALEKPTDNEKSLIMVGVGAFDIFRWSKNQKDFQTLLFLELRPNIALLSRRKVIVRPLIAWMYADFKASFIGAGLAFDFLISPQVTFTPSFAPGYFAKGGDIDLGYPLEFRTSLELAYRFKNKGRVGMMFSHISNAHLGKENPGADMLSIFYAIPFSLH
ncbi:hypothetical protein COB21_03830 [Candidatus Aerophobetes bacterium]|uniref:Acyloxyacyl hydrolase n=1 Tax=Aerophobetes bacterium TaxID=2030807 RepID=A0A2A4X3L2_UNCAE|nr:MAG: hypothetical protein COB21_03830 [Candidatus Aerophobetes bacterium]